jgi:quercetin dioxygenase-like cupin family protein
MTTANIPNLALLPELVKAGMGTAGHEEPLRIFGQEIYIKITGQQTGGAWSMIEQVTPPGSGAPVHMHSREDEAFFIAEGNFLFLVGEEKIETKPGDFLWAPRNVPHTFLNIGSIPARAIVVMSPPGLEDFFQKVAAIAGPPTPDQIASLFDEYGMSLLGPPLTL